MQLRFWGRPLAALVALLLACATPALAGPPFLTDDPEPVDYHHFEFYTFTTQDKAPDGTNITGPAIEYNIGAAPNVQIHFVVPFAFSSPVGGPNTSGLGDTEIGVKYRFVQETNNRPQIGIFPMIEVPTGNADKGLGNGRAWFRLPVWVQKSWGPWTTYGGGGVAINHAPGAQDYGFAGWLLQRDFGDHHTFGGEIFYQGSPAVGGQASTFYNVGGVFKPSDGFNVLYSVGHTISGDPHAIGYLGLYWTWGPQEKEEGAKP